MESGHSRSPLLDFTVKLMSTMVKTENVYYEYKSHNENELGVKAVDCVSMSIEKGQFVVILGRNGSGKSTISRLFNGLLLPQEGTVIVDKINTHNEELIWEVRKTLGLVLQNPDNQIVSTTVEEDVAFGPENLGVKPEEIRKKVDESLSVVDMLEYSKHSPHQLSGGQKQRIAIAGILAMEPECIVLDEATSMLDPSGRFEVVEVLKRLNKDRGITIILITHHMNEAVEADKVFVMEGGKIILDGTPRQIFDNVELIRQAGLDVPQVTALAYELKRDGFKISNLPLTTTEMIQTIKSLIDNKGYNKSPEGANRGANNVSKTLYSPMNNDISKDFAKNNEAIISINGLTHTYMQGSTVEHKAIKDINFTINKGEILGIIGQTGSGKSTLVQHFNGILKPTSGTLEVAGLKTEGKQLKELRQKVGLIFQYPEHQLFEETVYRDIIFGLNKKNLQEDEIKERVFHVIDLLGISPELLEKSPFELSGGQKRRVAIAGVLIMKPEVLVLDEPTAGLDPQGSIDVFEILSNLNKTEGTTIIVISHNMEEIAAYCHRVAVMNKGKLVACDTTQNIFSRYDDLKKYNLDIPKITKLFNSLRDLGYSLPKGILTVNDAVGHIKDLINNTCGGGN